MTPARRLTALLTIVALLLTALQPAAHGAARKDYVRHADDSCPGKEKVPPNYGHCPPWRVWLRSGRMLRLTDARRLQPGSMIPAPLGLSPHGSQMAYFRLKDDALVVRDVTTGTVRVVPGVKWVSGSVRYLNLSPGGRFALLTTLPGKLRAVDTTTGQVFTFPFTVAGLTFSPDNQYVLALQLPPGGGDAPRLLVVYATRTWTEVRRGYADQAGALSMGGTTVAYIDLTGARPAIRFRDVATGASIGSTIKIPAGEAYWGMVWDRPGHLDLLTKVGRSRGDVATFRWRRANAGMRILDTFTTDLHSRFPRGAGLHS